MVKLSPELIAQSAQYTNAVKDWELDLRGYKIPVIENMGATLDQFDCIDLSDNDIRKLDGFPLLKRLNTLLLNNNRICRLADNLEECLPKLEVLVLINNAIQELGDLDPLENLKSLRSLSLLLNPVVHKKQYRSYVIHKLPHLKILDFQKIRLKEREEANKLFKGKKGKKLEKDLGKKTQTFLPGEIVQEKIGPSAAEKEAIKIAIANASTLEEVERLNSLLRAGQIPGKYKNSQKNGNVDNENEDEDSMKA